MSTLPAQVRSAVQDPKLVAGMDFLIWKDSILGTHPSLSTTTTVAELPLFLLNGSWLPPVASKTLSTQYFLTKFSNCTNVKTIFICSLKVDYAAVLLGARRFTPFANPNEQISRIIRIVPVGSHTVLLQMENPVQLTQYVNPICLTSRYKLIFQLILRFCWWFVFYIFKGILFNLWWRETIVSLWVEMGLY